MGASYLSACETNFEPKGVSSGLGGVIALPSIFFMKNSEQVLATSLKINSDYATHFMPKLYLELLYSSSIADAYTTVVRNQLRGKYKKRWYSKVFRNDGYLDEEDREWLYYLPFGM
jgi:hypothetical protein